MQTLCVFLLSLLARATIVAAPPPSSLAIRDDATPNVNSAHMNYLVARRPVRRIIFDTYVVIGDDETFGDQNFGRNQDQKTIPIDNEFGSSGIRPFRSASRG
ncbi:hypothetical protein N657DRAFT_630581 [Parathielavia appendiculata]|uniref:Uncharacterized protein n=1 Tax=Parathielavia appendiculata TaxID=2587402 RepID=A0AAN6Z9F2_9PEZI|nr:hypothetical protein N657DRAFT_630581 [Parathielavia appendiculata]